MTQIEDLLREALASTPTTTATVDPLGAIDRRVRRARRWLAAGGVAVAAAVVAAVVVPIAVLGGNSTAPNGITIGNSPTPEPSVSNPPGVTTWWSSGALEVAASNSSGYPSWVLVRDTDRTFVAPVDPLGLMQRFTVPVPADFVVPGGGVEWIVGTDHSGNSVHVSVLDNANEGVTTQPLSGFVVSAPVVVGEALYLLTTGDSGTTLTRFELGSNGGIDTSQPLAIDGATEIAVTTTGHPWVLAGDKLVQVLTTGGQLSVGATVGWTGDIYGPTGQVPYTDDLWAYDGDRLIDLTPKYLTGCVSCAEGYRLNVAGRPGAVAADNDGSLFVYVPGKGIYYYPPADVQGAGAIPTAPLAVTVSSMVSDVHGGVTYVDDQGHLDHWDPAAGG
jgi:hypothetical protein